MINFFGILFTSCNIWYLNEELVEWNERLNTYYKPIHRCILDFTLYMNVFRSTGIIDVVANVVRSEELLHQTG